MSIEVRFKRDPKKVGKELSKKLEKFPKAANAGLRAVTLFLEGKVRDEFLTVVDGDPLKGDRRTKPDGLRRVSGETRDSLGFGYVTQIGNFIRGKGLSRLDSRILREKKLLREGIVGLDDPPYAVDHERFGRKRRPGFYPFLAPALKKYRRDMKMIFNKIFTREAKKR
jgi:hypothetical protein